MSTVPFTLYRCDTPACDREEMVSDQDALQSKLDSWLTIDTRLRGGCVHTKHYCPACSPEWVEVLNKALPAKEPR